MKKMLVLMMVLGLASAASAGIVLTVGGAVPVGDIVAAPGDVLSIGVLLEAGNYIAGGDFKFVSDAGTISVAGAVQPANYSAAFPGGEAAPMSFPASGVATLVPDAVNDVVSLGGITFNIVGAQQLFDLVSVTVTGTGTLDLSALANIQYLAVSGPMVTVFSAGGLDSVNIIPEPITIALLGLGGLFIRRRK